MAADDVVRLFTHIITSHYARASAGQTAAAWRLCSVPAQPALRRLWPARASLRAWHSAPVVLLIPARWAANAPPCGGLPAAIWLALNALPGPATQVNGRRAATVVRASSRDSVKAQVRGVAGLARAAASVPVPPADATPVCGLPAPHCAGCGS